MSSSSTLPSFVELMESLGLDHHVQASSVSSSRSSSFSSCTSSRSRHRIPVIRTSQHHGRSQSSSSLRDIEQKRNATRVARYSPYAATTNLPTGRRGSLPANNLQPSLDERPLRPFSIPQAPKSPQSPPPLVRHRSDSLMPSVYESPIDGSAFMPISSFVRRKTPSTSPTTPVFPQRQPSPPSPLMLPTLPPMFQQPMSYTFPPVQNTTRETEVRKRRSHHHIGVRISTSPRPIHARALAV